MYVEIKMCEQPFMKGYLITLLFLLIKYSALIQLELSLLSCAL